MSLIAERKRRNVFKLGAAHGIVAWPAIAALSLSIADAKPRE